MKWGKDVLTKPLGGLKGLKLQQRFKDLTGGLCLYPWAVMLLFHAARVCENQTTSKAPITVRVMGMRKVDDLRPKEKGRNFMVCHNP